VITSVFELLINSKTTGLFSIKVQIIDFLMLGALEASFFLTPKNGSHMNFFPAQEKNIFVYIYNIELFLLIININNNFGKIDFIVLV